MALLNIMSDITVAVPMAWPWELLLNDTFTFIASVAWRIVFLTVCLKLILSPLDFYQRYKMRKNQLITQRLQPQLDRLKKQYAGNEKVLQQKQAELNKKSGMNMFASCLPMIVTLVVFIWLWQSLNNIAQYNQFENYVDMYNAYNDSYTTAMGESDISTYASEYRSAYEVAFADDFESTGSVAESSEYAQSVAETTTDAVESYDALYKSTYIEWFEDTFEEYNNKSYTIDESIVIASTAGVINAKEIVELSCETTGQREAYNYFYGYGDYAEGGSKEDEAYEAQSFLWIKNVWSADVPWASVVKSTEDEFLDAVGDWATDSTKSDIDKTVLSDMVSMYETVTLLVCDDDESGVNGWLILPVLALLLNLSSQLITRRQQKKSGQSAAAEGQAGCMMNAMIFVLPVMMFVFALSYSAVFTLYMITNAAMGLTINLITSLIASKMVGGDNNKTTSGGVVVEQYGRKAPTVKKD